MRPKSVKSQRWQGWVPGRLPLFGVFLWALLRVALGSAEARGALPKVLPPVPHLPTRARDGATHWQ